MNKFEIAGLAILGLLFFVWPVPHMVSVRDDLLVFGVLAARRGWPREIFRHSADLREPTIEIREDTDLFFQRWQGCGPRPRQLARKENPFDTFVEDVKL